MGKPPLATVENRKVRAKSDDKPDYRSRCGQ